MGHAMWENNEPRRRQRGRRHSGHGQWGGPMGGPPPWLTQMFGPEWSGHSGRGGRRHRVRRGDVRTAILDVLGEAGTPMNGYQIIQEINERTEGSWKPSPGSVYPTISQLQDEELVEDAPSGRKALQLTELGRRHVEEHAEELAAVWAPFAAETDEEEAVSFKQVIRQTVGAVVQVLQVGTPDQWDQAVEILEDTRRRLYGLLAEGPGAEDDDEDGTDAR